MDLWILWIICAASLLAQESCSDVTIQQCPDGQVYVTEYSDVSLTCGPCLGLIEWYVDDNSGEDKNYVGECIVITCKVKNSAVFRLKLSTTNILSFESVLDILHLTRNNTRFVCECYYHFSNIFPPRGGFYLQSSDSCKLLIKEKKQPPSEHKTGGIVGGVFGAVVAIAIVGTIVTVYIVKRRKGSRGGNAQNETTNGNEGERTSKKSDSSTSSPGQAAGNGSKSGGSTPRSSSSGSDKPSTNPNYTSTALQEVEIHPYMDLHTRDPTYASTTSSKDPHMYMELKTLKALQPGSEKNGNDGYETPQVPGQATKSSDGYETPQPPREGRRRSATYANQGVPADPIQEEVNYYNEA